MESNTPKPVLYFDGVCNLCNGLVTFIIRHDKKEQFLFAPLQSEAGAAALANTPKANEESGSFILFYNSTYFTRSSAALNMFRLLGGGWSLLYSFIIIPTFIRDAVYNLISRNRYKWFGKKETCMIPTPELMKRFI